MTQIVHIINPVKVSEASDLFFAQPITFESLRKAKDFSTKKEQITLATTSFEEDHEIIPSEFQKLSNLSRSVLDVNSNLKGKKLPLIADILAKTEEVNSCDFVLYTNVDIAVMPQFYDALFEYIEQGHDAVIINRRRIETTYKTVDKLSLMYSDLGKSHPGFDCFLFKKELLEKLILDDVCIGIPFLEVSLIHNLFSFAEKPLFVPDAHLTFHLGMDVMPPINKDFYWHNRNTFFKKINPKLKDKYALSKFPYSELSVPKRAIKWMLNPGVFFRTYIKLEGKNFWQKLKFRLNEIRWRMLQK